MGLNWAEYAHGLPWWSVDSSKSARAAAGDAGGGTMALAAGGPGAAGGSSGSDNQGNGSGNAITGRAHNSGSEGGSGAEGIAMGSMVSPTAANSMSQQTPTFNYSNSNSGSGIFGTDEKKIFWRKTCQRLVYLYVLCGYLLMIGMRFHYTVDIFVGFVICVLLWKLYFHTIKSPKIQEQQPIFRIIYWLETRQTPLFPFLLSKDVKLFWWNHSPMHIGGGAALMFGEEAVPVNVSK
jgi:hypothetical protein